jgi:hypothetical protein
MSGCAFTEGTGAVVVLGSEPLSNGALDTPNPGPGPGGNMRTGRMVSSFPRGMKVPFWRVFEQSMDCIVRAG